MVIAALDYRSTHARTQGDLAGVEHYLRQLVGEPFLFVRETYGDEATFHFGVEKEIRLPRGQSVVEGTYVLGLRASAWQVKSRTWNSGLSVSPGNSPHANLKDVSIADLEHRSPITAGARVMEVLAQAGVGGVELTVLMSDHSALCVRPTREQQSAESGTVADWELFTPFNRCLHVGPGISWEYVPSDSVDA